MKKIIIIILFFIIISFFGALYTNLISPYSSISLIKPFFVTEVLPDNSIQLIQQNKINFISTPFDWDIHMMTSLFRVFGNAKFSEKPFCCTEQEIIEKIHNERFDVNKPYIISGGHFTEFYTRNFGLFYSAVMDGRIGLSERDWINRQRTILQTLSTNLELIRQAGKTFSTFEIIAPNTFVGENVYTDQSDSIFSVMWTLNAITNENFLSNIFPGALQKKSLNTKIAGEKLIKDYKNNLEVIINNYLSFVIDKNTGLIKKNITLSSARDGIMRQSSFYDNVIAWSTVKLARNIGLNISCPKILSDCNMNLWKKNIIAAFWDDKNGIFLDDLSDESKQNEIFSGDEFIVTSTQFLDLNNPKEREMAVRMINYVKKQKLDQPLPLRYALKDQPDRFYWPVRLFMGSYMGESIWSHWGIEYIKTLILLSKDNPAFLSDAKVHMEAYKKNIEKYGGYPELYDKNGNIFETPFYKSLLHTGWVINYEQARMMLDSIGK